MAIFRLPGATGTSKRVPFAPFRTIGFLLVQFVVLALLLLGVLLVHTNQDLATLDAYTAYMTQLAQIDAEASQTWVTSGSTQALEQLRQGLARMTPQLLRHQGDAQALEHLRDLAARASPREFPEVMSALADLSLSEHRRGWHLVLAAGRDARYTLIGTGVALLAFMIFVLVTLAFFRLRILRPLRRLQEAMHSLEVGAFARVAEGQADPGISPLLHYYNQMVGRLEELERQRRQYLQDLQREVHQAAHTLIAQQAAMARSERLAAVGEAAAALAHELRNPLAGLQVGCANIRREIADADINERLGLMEDELRRVSRLLDHQLRGARQAQEAGQWVNPAETLESLINLLRYQVPGNIRLTFQAEATGRCLLPLDHFRQAVLNLLLNAIQALGSEGGEIRVQLSRRDPDLELAVCDNGPGFPETLLREGIRPFASTREQGTGLGLSMVRRFARSLGGSIQLANAEPQGAVVVLHLPCPENTAKEPS
ncbi:HAMP domain-containing histidine kinase [Acidithiobacillus caldus]|uniref:sensor histidine kinase n=1 Tax=Acidithiobacillus caldus TaxID=33059 RepID=UPI001C066591|nr:HAMP domain-containing sensor histidine kinase [Acidithiobacillus caldus]MBU2801374.1 HAMP domain-containing histidine kinase [Acidithiobacillus caldus]